jgi:hypothetical protein
MLNAPKHDDKTKQGPKLLTDAIEMTFKKNNLRYFNDTLQQISLYSDPQSLKDYINSEDLLGNTALHTCFRLYTYACERYLADNTIDIRKLEGKRSLFLSNTINITTQLINAGLDHMKANKAGQTALDVILSHKEGKLFAGAIIEDIKSNIKIDITKPLAHTFTLNNLTNQTKNTKCCMLI